jgi:trk system potassium uptake protein TrkA
VEAHDELLFITTPDNEDVLEQMLSPGTRPPRDEDYR